MKVSIGNYHKDPTKPRKIKIEIKGYDLFALNSTLALIILPCLQAFQENTSSYPVEFKELDAWKNCLDEMIMAFTILADDTECIPYSDPCVRRGLDLFSQYYLHLWD